MKTIADFIKNAPKAELHVHIEGTLEPEMALKFAKRNNIDLGFPSVASIRERFHFADLQEFLTLYSQLIRVLIKEEDFYELGCAYFNRAQKNNVRHAEIFFDLQGHLRRGIPLSVVMSGLMRACGYGNFLGISSYLMLCFLRDLPEADAHAILRQALPFKNDIIAVGLASAEKGNPPSKFACVFQEALDQGFLTVAHAGEEGPVAYIWQALDILHVSRIDHGNACINDPDLIRRLAHDHIPLTMCPLSNVKLGVVTSLKEHPAKLLLDAGVCVTINSDDPAYFGGYINDNLQALAEALELSMQDVYTFIKNGFEASFLPEEKKAELLSSLEHFHSKYLLGL